MFYFLFIGICEKSGTLAVVSNSTDDPQHEDFLKCFNILSNTKPAINIIDTILTGSIIYYIYIKIY